jgi:MFS family permease
VTEMGSPPTRAAEGTGTPAEPTLPVPRSWTVRFGLVWFGYWMATLVPVQLVLPTQLDDLDPVHKVRDFGLISGLTGIAALVTLPLFGAWCDRTTSRVGRRKIWVAGGLVVFAAGLIATGYQSHWIGVGVAWLVATLGANAASVGLTATVADSVPDEQRGTISAAIYAPQAIGIVIGLFAVTAVGGSIPGSYAFLAVALLVTGYPFLRAYREITPPEGAYRRVSLLDQLRVGPLPDNDFHWAFACRVLVNLGNALGTTYLYFFLKDGLKLEDPDEGLLVLTVVYLIFTLFATTVGGYLSDRFQRRRVFVAAASILQAIAALLLAAFPSFGIALVGAALLGAGYGAFMSVDQALITQVLPDAASRAKDLGIMNVGSVGPQALAPLAASLVISSLGGYPVLFGLAGVTTLVGAAMVYQVKSVR